MDWLTFNKYVPSLRIKEFLFFAAAALSLVGQALLTSSCRNWYGPYYSPIIWLLAGLSFCLFAFLFFLEVGKRPFQAEKKGSVGIYIPWLVLLAGSVLGARKFSRHLEQYAIDPDISDIIPLLSMYVDRFLSGIPVYGEAFDLGGWKVVPNYLPLHWMPFIPAEWLNLDFRGWSFLLFLAGTSLWYSQLSRKKANWVSKTGVSLLPLAVWLVLLYGDATYFGMTVELAYISFYFLLGYALLNGSSWWIGIGILLCLLSRYSFTFWLPAFFLAYFLEKGWRPSLVTASVILAGVLALYIIPFFFKDPGILSRGMAMYNEMAMQRWQPEFWQEAGAIPFYVNNGLSFTYWFYSLEGLDLESRFNLAQQSLKIIALLGGALIFLLYWMVPLFKRHWRAYWCIGIVAFLNLFYSFMYVPYGYLFLLPPLLGSVVLVGLWTMETARDLPTAGINKPGP